MAKIFSLFFVVCALVFSLANAAEQRYFSALPDIPLLDTMKEIDDMTVVFDKEGGQIVETAAFYPVDSSKNAREKAKKLLESTYRETVIHLGWTALKPWVFVRKNEQLIGKIEEVPKGLVLRLQLSPVSR